DGRTERSCDKAVAKMPLPRPCKAGIARAYREAEPEGMAASSLASPSPAPIAKETCHAKQENAEPGGQMCTDHRQAEAGRHCGGSKGGDENDGDPVGDGHVRFAAAANARLPGGAKDQSRRT